MPDDVNAWKRLDLILMNHYSPWNTLEDLEEIFDYIFVLNVNEEVESSGVCWIS